MMICPQTKGRLSYLVHGTALSVMKTRACDCDPHGVHMGIYDNRNGSAGSASSICGTIAVKEKGRGRTEKVDGVYLL